MCKHHAEPLGAELFARTYPDLSPSYAQFPDCFHKLWKDAVIRQKNKKFIWKGFYANDCLTDIKFTAYLIGLMMGTLRVLGDDERFADWYEDLCRTQSDRQVRLLSITTNHMTNQELFDKMKKTN